MPTSLPVSGQFGGDVLIEFDGAKFCFDDDEDGGACGDGKKVVLVILQFF